MQTLEEREQKRKQRHEEIRASVEASKNGDDVPPIESRVPTEPDAPTDPHEVARAKYVLVTWRPQVIVRSSDVCVNIVIEGSKVRPQTQQLEGLRRELFDARPEDASWVVGQVVLPPVKEASPWEPKSGDETK